MAAANAEDCVSVLDMNADDPRLLSFLKGETIDAPGCSGWTAVAVYGIITGFGKVSGGILKNRYPKGLRLRNG
jgi:NOL1/NOP2/fmu family ribosome biogenesis protein